MGVTSLKVLPCRRSGFPVAATHLSLVCFSSFSCFPFPHTLYLTGFQFQNHNTVPLVPYLPRSLSVMSYTLPFCSQVHFLPWLQCRARSSTVITHSHPTLFKRAPSVLPAVSRARPHCHFLAPYPAVQMCTLGCHIPLTYFDVCSPSLDCSTPLAPAWSLQS